MSYECMYVCIYPCIHPLLFSHEKGGHVAIHEHMDGAEHIMLSEVSQTEKDKYSMISHVKSKKAKLTKTESKVVVTRGLEVGEQDRTCLKVQTYNE